MSRDLANAYRLQMNRRKTPRQKQLRNCLGRLEARVSSLVLTVGGLPERIRRAFSQNGLSAETFRAALKSAYKPNATIPIIWVVVIAERLLLCTTHRERWLWQEYHPDTLDSVRVLRNKVSGLSLVIIGKEVGHGIVLGLQRDTTLDAADRFAQIANTLTTPSL